MRHPVSDWKQAHAALQGPGLPSGLSLGRSHLERLCGGREWQGGLLLTSLSGNSWCFSTHNLRYSLEPVEPVFSEYKE